MQITVLGGSGFIGTRLVAALRDAGHGVRIFDKAPSAAFPDLVMRGDVRDAAAVATALAGCDAAIDLAAEHRDDVQPASLYAEVNLGGARNVVAAAAAHGVSRLVFTSSVAVYGLAQPLAHESAPLQPAGPYGRSKLQAEAVYRDWADASSARSLLLLRPCVVFGEGNRGNVHVLIERMRRRRFVMVGDGGNRKSMAYVGNLVDFLVKRIAAPTSGTLVCNYADKPDPRMCDLVRGIAAHLPGPTRLPPRVPAMLALPAAALLDAGARLLGRGTGVDLARLRKFRADTTVATPLLEQLGFIPRVTFDEALQRTVARVIADAADTASAPDDAIAR